MWEDQTVQKIPQNWIEQLQQYGWLVWAAWFVDTQQAVMCCVFPWFSVSASINICSHKKADRRVPATRSVSSCCYKEHFRDFFLESGDRLEWR